jgi:hypothetical protein
MCVHVRIFVARDPWKWDSAHVEGKKQNKKGKNMDPYIKMVEYTEAEGRAIRAQWARRFGMVGAQCSDIYPLGDLPDRVRVTVCRDRVKSRRK